MPKSYELFELVFRLSSSMFFCVYCFFFFFSSRRRHTRWNCDWSSDVCSSDLIISAEIFNGCWLVENNIAWMVKCRSCVSFEEWNSEYIKESRVSKRHTPLLEIGRASCRERV